MWIIKNKKLFVIISFLLVIASFSVIAVKGVNYSIEFKGGSVLEVEYAEEPNIDVVKLAVEEAGFESARVQPFGENGVIVRDRDLSEAERIELVNAMAIGENVPEQRRYNSIGPSIGKELRTKALIALFVVAFAIILFVAYAFRKVAKPVSSWKYGLIAVIALIHDVVIPVGIFALFGLEVGTLFVVGLLSILGLSVNDTIVVFDRIRENLASHKGDTMTQDQFGGTVGKSIKQTVARSINTSFTLVVVLVALYVVGPVATQDLALVLLIGTLLGTYSSLFLASPLLVMFNQKKKLEMKEADN